MTDQTCRNCKHADWNKTKNGRRHTYGGGWCSFHVVLRLPRAADRQYGTAEALQTLNRRWWIEWKTPHTDCDVWESA